MGCGGPENTGRSGSFEISRKPEFEKARRGSDKNKETRKEAVGKGSGREAKRSKNGRTKK